MIFLTIVCYRCTNGYKCFTPPTPLYLCYSEVKNQDLVGATKKVNVFKLDSLVIFYYKNGIKNVIDYKTYTMKDKNGKDKFILELQDREGAVSWRGQGTIYYALTSHHIDTITTFIQERSRNQCTYFETTYIKYNGKDLEVDDATGAFVIE